MRDYRSVRDVLRIGGGPGLHREQGKIVDAVFPGSLRPQIFRHQRRPMDNYYYYCSSGRGGMAQDGGTKGRNVSWRNRPLQIKSGVDYGMQ